MRIVLFGPPGAGKGTQASHLAKQFDAVHISTGDTLREAAARGVGLGANVRDFLERGELAPDELVIGIVTEKLQSLGSKGFILDGFPRTVNQAEVLEDFLEETNRPLRAVVNLKIDVEELKERLMKRWVCTKCGEVYNALTKQSDIQGICDKCQSSLVHRADDTPEAIEHRMDVYHKSTKPVLDYYAKTGLVKDIDAVGSVDEVFNRIIDSLGLKV